MRFFLAEMCHEDHSNFRQSPTIGDSASSCDQSRSTGAKRSQPEQQRWDGYRKLNDFTSVVAAVRAATPAPVDRADRAAPARAARRRACARRGIARGARPAGGWRSEEHTSELQPRFGISYA